MTEVKPFMHLSYHTKGKDGEGDTDELTDTEGLKLALGDKLTDTDGLKLTDILGDVEALGETEGDKLTLTLTETDGLGLIE